MVVSAGENSKKEQHWLRSQRLQQSWVGSFGGKLLLDRWPEWQLTFAELRVSESGAKEDFREEVQMWKQQMAPNNIEGVLKVDMSTGDWQEAAALEQLTNECLASSQNDPLCPTC